MHVARHIIIEIDTVPYGTDIHAIMCLSHDQLDLPWSQNVRPVHWENVSIYLHSYNIIYTSP